MLMQVIEYYWFWWGLRVVHMSVGYVKRDTLLRGTGCCLLELKITGNFPHRSHFLLTPPLTLLPASTLNMDK
jgi:hypothetical protein